MADYGFADPRDVASTNPYLMPQQAPDWRQVIGNALLGVGAGISNADASGRGWGAGIGPGLMYGANLTGQQQQQAFQRQIQAAQYQALLDHRRTQDEATREKMAMARAAQARDASLGDQIGTMLGMNVPQSPVRMGPDFQNEGKAKVDYLVQKHGMSPVAAATVVGNLYQESGFRPDAVGDGGTAYGQAQWRGDRQAGLLNFAKAQGKPPNDPNVQLDYLVTEMKGGDMGAQRAYAGIQQAKTPEEATAAMMHFFRPAGYTPSNPTAGHGYHNRVQYTQALLPNGQPVPVGEGGPPGSPADAPTQQNALASLPPEVRASIGIMAKRDPEKALTMLVGALQNQKKEDSWAPLNAESAKMYLGKAYDEGKAYQRNRITGKIEPINTGPLVNVDMKSEAEFGKEMGKMDAQRFGKIIEAEGTMNDMASKLGFALDQFKQTYTGPGAEAANQLNRILGAAGFEEAAKKANAADAAQAVVSQMKPHMRASGSGASSDKDMDMFAKALPSLMNLPDGNERIVTFFQKMADRATKIRELAQEHSEGGRVPLTRTQFDAEVKKLGPLFTEDEKKLLEGVSKAAPKADRPPISSFGREVPTPSMAPTQRPPLSSFGGGR
jgi:hypothetical protein